MKTKVLVTGANGQIGTVLTDALRAKYGIENVLASDIKERKNEKGQFEFLDILNVVRLEEIIEDHAITEIYHLAAILSANGEWNPTKTWNVNLNGFLSILEIAERKKLDKLFFPSSIAVFGHTTPQIETPQDAPLLPETIYGMSKYTGELWCNYYFKRYGLDVRSIRYPGIIGHQSLPEGGTTDYAVEIYHAALIEKHYECFLKPDTRLPMMYMPDMIRATIELMSAPKEMIKTRYGYNLSGMSFTPAEIAKSIQQFIPDFTITYKPDFRQAIADSWSESIDDTRASEEWDWKANFNLESMTKDMLEKLSNKKFEAIIQ
ncbi:MAG: NAD-dependent epimerase/dehydratase family protein [Bacteroidota bacterium]